MAWTQLDAEHLLRRATFGSNQADVDALLASGRQKAISTLLEHTDVPDPVWADPNPLGFDNFATSALSARRNLLYKLITSTRPLQVRMLWFWHGHFTTSMHDTNIHLMERQVLKWRHYATGSFLQFLLAMYTDGAMLQYLDGDINTKNKPNENFARENFELFTMGAGAFSEIDVREAARAFTGVLIGDDGVVTRDPKLHDHGAKSILGQSAPFSGNDVMRLIFDRPETARHVCSRLYRTFVSEQVNSAELDALVDAWVVGAGSIKQVISAMLQLPGFWSSTNRTKLIKNPLQFAIGLVKRLELDVSPSLVDRMFWDLQGMGYRVWCPSSPAGYPMGVRVLGSSQVLARFAFAYHCIYERSTPTIVAAMARELPSRFPAQQFPMLIAQRLGLAFTTASTQQTIGEYLGPEDITSSNLTTKTLATTYLLACSPEYQLA